MRITVRNQLHIRALWIIVIALLFWNWSISNKLNKLTNAPEINRESVTTPLVDPAIIDAVIMIESSGNERAYNKHTGAVGLTQLTPIIYHKVCGLTKEEAFNPDKNIACASLFLKSLMNKYGGNLEKSLSYYNNGHIGSKKYSKKVTNLLDK